MWDKTELGVNEIEVDMALQMRAAEPSSEDYEELLRKNKKEWPFPCLRCIQVGDRILVVEGFTRLRAATDAGWKKVPVEIRSGTWQDAVAEACASNADHGFRRNAADKRRAIIRAAEEISSSPTKVAAVCRVSRSLVYTVLDNGKPPKAEKTKTASAPVSASPDPVRPPKLSEIDDECPCCGGAHWTATDAGYSCSTCQYELGEVAGAEAEEREDRAGRRELIEDGVKRDLAAVSSDYGRLLRALSRAGLAESTERQMLAIHKKIQEAIRAQRRS